MKRTFLISGAGSGIGRAIVQQLALAGHNCFLLGRSARKLEETLETLTGDGHKLLTADVRDKRSLATAAKKVKDIAIDGLVANAGIGGENRWGRGDRWQDIIDTNLTGTYSFVNTFLPNLQMEGDSERHIIITSSVLARLGVADYPAYCASKAGLLGLMRSWAVEFAPQRILVNAICPGWVDTEMSQTGMEGIASSIGITPKEFHDLAMQSVPLRRMSQPEEIALLVKFLLEQRAMTGQTIDMNGGAVMNS